MPTMTRTTLGAILGGLLVVGTAVGVGVATAGPSPEEAWTEINDQLLPDLQAEAEARTALASASRAVADAQAALAAAQQTQVAAQAALVAATAKADAAEARLGELRDVELPLSPEEAAASGQMRSIGRYLQDRHASGAGTGSGGAP